MEKQSRRDFLFTVLGSVLVPALASRAEDRRETRSVRDLEIRVTRLLFFPECRETTADHCALTVAVTALRLDPRASTVVVEFSNGRSLELEADTSYAASERPMREKIRLKVLAAWALAAAVQWPGHLSRSTKDSLQEQTVLEAVTPRSLYELVERLQRNEGVSDLAWDGTLSLFVVR